MCFLNGAVWTLLWLVMFWNVENFFYPEQDGENDTEYIPEGWRHWNWGKFNKKCDDIAKIVVLAGEKYGRYPILIGLCEVENRKALNGLLYNTMLSRLGYGVIHRDSPDKRGIDVALLYREEEFTPLKKEFLQIPGKEKGSILPTREILYVMGVANEIDTLHCFVNHWPSKLGGRKRSEHNRVAAMERLRGKCDSLFKANTLANIIIMGDFNDGPDSPLLSSIGGVKNMSCNPAGKEGGYKGVGGTYKYKGEWERIDHFLLSKNLYDGLWFNAEGGDEIFITDYLLEEDAAFSGVKIRRTFIGPRYNGGVSDHLPIILKIQTVYSEFLTNFEEFFNQ